MRNPFYVILALMACLCFSDISYAAFPMHEQDNNAVVYKKRSFDEFVNTAIERYHLPVPEINEPADAGDTGLLSILSFVFGTTGFIALVGAAFASSPILLVLALMLGIAGIVLGAKGSKHSRLRGLGIAGLVMGIVDVGLILATVILTLIIIAAFV
jgi:hypothetical protein